MLSRHLAVSLIALALLPRGAFAATTASPPSESGTPVVSLEVRAGEPDHSHLFKLRGTDSRAQLLVTAKAADGSLLDYTRSVKYDAEPKGIVTLDANGMVRALKDGVATITAETATGITTEWRVQVENCQTDVPINFANQIVPIFTKAGCNAGGCHGKSSGQNGFRLSLLGFEPAEDYEHLVREARGRRLFPAAPDRSLLLMKATATVPHGGGNRLETSGEDYRLIVRWITQGMPYGSENDPVIDRIEVFPKERTMPLGGEQQLAVSAYYSDGSSEDVTRSALFEPNDKEMAKAGEDGLVKLYRQPGDVAVMIRYQAKVAVFRATIPLGAPVTNLPPARNFIDEAVFQKLRTIGMPASEICDDSTFVRRVTLDVTGRLPTSKESADFLADTRPDKRDRWVDSLLETSAYADHFATKWTALLRNKRADSKQTRMTYAFHSWVRDSLLENKHYDQIVRELLTASGDFTENPAAAWYAQAKDTTTELEDTAQVFLGQRLKCAQCHHHPFERWSQKDYYSFSAFFSQVSRKQGSQPGQEVVFARRAVPGASNKKTGQSVKPAGLGAAPLKLTEDDDARQALVDWMTSKDNRFFSRTLVNRYWKHFFNRGLVEPEDDMRETNPATNPELLDALARSFTDSRYDLKQLIRTICDSQTYQLSSIPNAWNRVDKQNYSRYYPRRLTAEALLDSVDVVTLSETKFDGLPVGTRAVELPDNSFNASSYFLTVFGRPDMASSCECERSQDASLAQSLHLLNAKEIQDKLARDSGRPALLARESEGGDDKPLHELYLLACSRQPAPEELESAKRYIEKRVQAAASPTVGKRQAYEDIVWAVLNTKEFLFNH